MGSSDLNYFLTLLYLKIDQYNEKDYSNFFLYNNEDFIFITSFVYFLLLKEKIIDKDKKNPNVKSRLSLNLDIDEIDYIFKNNNISIVNFSSIQLLDNIRDSILHGCFDIDVDKKIVHINNTFKNFSIDLNFNFFKDFAGRHLNEITYIENQKNFSFDIAFFDIENIYSELYLNTTYYDEDINSIKSYDSFKNYMSFFENYKIFVNSKDNENIDVKDINPYKDRGLIVNSDVFYFSKEVKTIAYEIYPKIVRQVFMELIKQKKIINVENKKKMFEQLFIDNLSKKIHDKYPNLSFNIVKQSLNQEIIDFIYNKRIYNHNEFFNKTFKEQNYEIQKSLTQALESNETGLLLGSLNDLVVSLELINKIFSNVNNNMSLEVLLHAMNDSSTIMNFIHKLRKENNLTYNDTYDNCAVWYNLNMEPHITDDEYEQLKDYFDKNFTQISLSNLKKANYQIYLKYYNYFKDNDKTSDQDVNYFSELNKYTIEIDMIKCVLAKYRYIMPMSFIYILLTGIFSPNVNNSLFNSQHFMNELCKKIKCYSSSYYNKNIDVKENIKNKIIKKKFLIDNLKKQYNQSKDVKTKNLLQSKVFQIEKELDEYYQRINDDIIEVDGIKFQRTNIDETLSRLRNVFSHLERVRILDFENGDIELIDYNDSKQVAVIRVNIKDILSLFSIYNKGEDIEHKHLI